MCEYKIIKADKEEYGIVNNFLTKLNEQHVLLGADMFEHTDVFLKEKIYKRDLKYGVLYFLLYVDEQPEGVICLEYREGNSKDYGYISSLYIEEEYRHCGFGKKLIEHAIKYFKENIYNEEYYYDKVYLHAYYKNSGIVDLYKNYGFEEVKCEMSIKI